MGINDIVKFMGHSASGRPPRSHRENAVSITACPTKFALPNMWVAQYGEAH